MPVRIWKILDILDLIKKISGILPLSDLLKLLDLPDWQNAEDVRKWAVRLLAVGEGVADGTTNKIDDTIVDLGQVLTSDPETWSTFYGILWDLDEDNIGSNDVDSDSRVKLLADKASIDPATIILIIQAVMQVISWWRDRRNVG